MQFCGHCGAQMTGGGTCPVCGAPSQRASGGLPGTPYGAIGSAPGRAGQRPAARSSLTVTAICNGEVLAEAQIAQFGKAAVTFGSADDNDIVIRDPGRTVSRWHGAFVVEGDACSIVNRSSTNGLFSNGVNYESMAVNLGDVITIGAPAPNQEVVVLLIGRQDLRWRPFDLSQSYALDIGRTDGNGLVLPYPTVSAQHAMLRRDRSGNWWVRDNDSFNGTFVNGAPARQWLQLVPGSSLRLANITVVYSGQRLFRAGERLGVDLMAFNLTKRRNSGKRTRTTNDNISLHIKRGQFVAIAGGSGSGKTTLLNALCGSEPADEGAVLVDGVQLYENYRQLKNTIGYVPQQDIVYDNLSLSDMLRYSAKLRMPPDATAEEREQRIAEVVHLLELDEVRDNLIANMSGGQKKRASIAVELLADPRLLFLDEPTSGLDPGIEQHLMEKLADMAHEGRTIVLVTHTTLNLHLCDQVVFLGVGGKLCYAGPPQQALDFFGVSDFVGIYPQIGQVQQADTWKLRFDRSAKAEEYTAPATGQNRGEQKAPSFLAQLGTLSTRYMKLLVNDRARLLLLLAQAPVLAALICLVAGEGCFTEYESTKSCLFALSCAAFWVGVLNSIQEICKERDIFEREYAGGMRIAAYVLSKCIVLGLLCIVQALLLTGVFCALEPPPADSLLFAPLELLVTNFLIAFSAMCLGLLVSSLFRNPDRAIAMAPLLIMPQILFSGLVFELKGVAEAVSLFVHCRWGMEAFGTTANLNELDLSIYGEEITVPETETTVDEVTATVPSFDTTVDEVTTTVPSFDTTISGQQVTVPEQPNMTMHDVSLTVPEQPDMTLNDITVTVPEDTKTIDADMFPHDYEAMFEFTMAHLATSWSVLAAFSAACIAGCCVVLRAKARG